jgi:dolichol-phosphate mannosyltransferase
MWAAFVRQFAAYALTRRGKKLFAFLGAMLLCFATTLLIDMQLYASAGFTGLLALAAVVSFAVAVTNNYAWNRLWTFRRQRGHVVLQGARFLVVSLLALGANLAVLAVLVAIGTPKVPAQAAAIILVTPLSFLGNKLWSFR